MRALLALLFVLPLARGDDAREIGTIAFGSCAHQSRSQTFWKPILEAQPDVFIFCGDNIYSDTYKMDLQWSKYEQLGAQKGFQVLREQVPVLAVWDDHDYGLNDSGAEFREKVASKANFLRFWDSPSNTARQASEGIYDARVFGPEGRRVQILLLDTRYNRGPLTRLEERAGDGGPYGVSTNAGVPLLGEKQWVWLEKELGKSADLRVLVSSIQIVSDDHHWESWSRLPHERARLFALIRKTGADGVIAISGDRHHGELCVDRTSGPYPLYDLTSSGLNMTHTRNREDPHGRRIGEEAVMENNFGLIRVNWTNTPASIELSLVDVDGRTQQRHSITRSELVP